MLLCIHRNSYYHDQFQCYYYSNFIQLILIYPQTVLRVFTYNLRCTCSLLYLKLLMSFKIYTYVCIYLYKTLESFVIYAYAVKFRWKPQNTPFRYIVRFIPFLWEYVKQLSMIICWLSVGAIIRYNTYRYK